jgi:hypothetical protein
MSAANNSLCPATKPHPTQPRNPTPPHPKLRDVRLGELEAAEHAAHHSGRRPERWIGLRRVDAIDWLRDEVSRLEREVLLARERALVYNSSPSSFVLFRCQPTAHTRGAGRPMRNRRGGSRKSPPCRLAVLAARPLFSLCCVALLVEDEPNSPPQVPEGRGHCGVLHHPPPAQAALQGKRGAGHFAGLAVGWVLRHLAWAAVKGCVRCLGAYRFSPNQPGPCCLLSTLCAHRCTRRLVPRRSTGRCGGGGAGV